MNTQKPILISGGGLSSLLLARALLHSNVSFLIFEKDSSISFRAQGYRLRLSQEGLDAVKSVLGPEAFEKFWIKCRKTAGSGLTAVNARTGIKMIDNGIAPIDSHAALDSPEPQNRMKAALETQDGKVVGIARGDMRRIFMEGCEPYIKWAHDVTGYELTDSGVRAVFSDGSKSIEGQMLIGGDGVHSKVAKQLSDGRLKVYDTGARAIHGETPMAAFKQFGEGVWKFVDNATNGKRVFVVTNVRPEVVSDPNIKIGWVMGIQSGVIDTSGDDYLLIGEPAANMVRSLTKEWHPEVKHLFDEMVDREAAYWKITCSTPSGIPDWRNEPRVTVIGDAAHSMTPAGGIGGNTAVRDSAFLGRLIREAGGFRAGLTLDYEREMRIYGSEAVARSYAFAKSQFGMNIDEHTKTI
ncbi:6-hydroxynicotinate 3-monooxygenase [Beauveria bassiana]|uniref:6-hydroxynicotinate 3-monooxygenase n=1 Tax=Beauveria bassiana TaxID=176275 RepID=A0A2N6NGH1_BEABA|nr:6-hydroxynicotinate 3-monooxygenase [Beauveria bassiana]